jgi:hypothetical protein
MIGLILGSLNACLEGFGSKALSGPVFKSEDLPESKYGKAKNLKADTM